MKPQHSHHKACHARGRCMGMGLIAMFFWALVLKFVWNQLVPDLFNGPFISYWQSFGLLLMSRILFGGWRRGCHGRGRWRARFKEKIRQKMEKMSPEERKRFKEGFKSKWWDVNVWEVEEEEQHGDGSEDAPDGDGPEKK